MDITSIVAQNYAAGKAATAPEQGTVSNGFVAAFDSFKATLDASEATAMQSMTNGTDPHALVTALAQTELAVQTAVTVRDRVVEAYQEILRMPI
jgi:flagellar hook-basal body complex protein FliE